MKKVLLAAILVLTMALTCSCVEEITDDSVPGLGPMEPETSPTAPSPMTNLDPVTIPDSTDTDDPSEPDNGEETTDPGEGDEPDITLDDISLDNGAGTDNKAVSTALSGYPSNPEGETSAKGDVVKTYVSGNTTVYRVQYVRTMSFIVEVTSVGDNVKVDVYLEHYRLNLGADKEVRITIGDHSGKAMTAELDWENNTAAKTLLMSATAPKGDGDTVKIEAEMFFGGTYHKEKIENLELSVDHKIN